MRIATGVRGGAVAALGALVFALAPPSASGASIDATAELSADATDDGGVDFDGSGGEVPFDTTFSDAAAADAPNGGANSSADLLATIVKNGDNFQSMESAGSASADGSAVGNSRAIGEIDVEFVVDRTVTVKVRGTLDVTIAGDACASARVVVGNPITDIAEEAGDQDCFRTDAPTHVDVDQRVTFRAGNTNLIFLDAEAQTGSNGESASASYNLTFTPIGVEDPIECGEVIRESIVLDRNLTCTGHGLTVGAPGITLDLGGHHIQGDLGGSDFGINNSARHSDVKIRNGEISNFGTGVFTGGDGPKVSGLLVHTNNNGGVFMPRATTGTVRNVTARFNQADGIEITCEGCLVKDNLSELNDGDGIQIGNATGSDTSTTNTVTGNRSQKNGAAGFRILGDSDFTTLENNKAIDNDLDGFAVLTDDNDLVENIAKENGASGFRLSGAKRNELKDNVSKVNDQIGFLVATGDHNVLRKNRATANKQEGFVLLFTTDNTLKSNIAEENELGGVRLDGASGNTLIGNTAKLNLGDGLSTGDGFTLQTSAAGNILQGNLATKNAKDGIALSAADINLLDGNTAKFNEDDGIVVDANSEDNEVKNNVASDNDDIGLEVADTTTFGANNLARRNGFRNCDIVVGAAVACS